MKAHYGKGHREVSYSEGALVWLCLYTGLRRANRNSNRNSKLQPRYFEPFKVIRKIGSRAYKLELPPSKIHDIFYISLLKPFHGDPALTMPALPPPADGRVVPTPQKILRARMYKGEWEILVLWQGFQKLTLLGNHCLNLLPLILLLSLRTSSLSRREEMLWMHIQDMCIRRGIGLMSTTNN